MVCHIHIQCSYIHNLHTHTLKLTLNLQSIHRTRCTEKCLSIIKFEMKIKVFQVWMLMCLLYVRYASNANSFAVPNQSRKNTKTMYKWLSEFTNKMSIKTLKSFQIIVWQKNAPTHTIGMDSYLFCVDCDCCCRLRKIKCATWLHTHFITSIFSSTQLFSSTEQ